MISLNIIIIISSFLLGFTVAVDSSTGVLTLVRSLDREVAPTFNISIAAQDQGLGNNQAIVCILTAKFSHRFIVADSLYPYK